MATKHNASEQLLSIAFDAPLQKIDKWAIVLLSEEESVKFSSRGQVCVVGKINDYEFKTVLEPDGRWSHWFKVDEAMRKGAGIQIGDVAAVELMQSKDWPEPTVPEDFATELAAAPEAIQKLWSEITPMARWEWIRWVNATRDASTRKRRVEVSISKMKSGKRRPCCFNLAACTDPDLSRSGRLMEPIKV